MFSSGSEGVIVLLFKNTEDSLADKKCAHVNNVVAFRSQVPIKESDLVVILFVNQEVSFVHVTVHNAESLVIDRQITGLNVTEFTTPDLVHLDHLLVGLSLYLFELSARVMESSNLFAEFNHELLKLPQFWNKTLRD